MKPFKVKLALSVMLAALVSTEYVLACFRNVVTDCAADCSAQPCVALGMSPTVMFGDVLEYRTTGGAGATGYQWSLHNMNAQCSCTYQVIVAGSVETTSCNKVVTRDQADTDSTTCNF